MKRIVYLISVGLIVLSYSATAQTDTITGWDFSDTTNASFNANMGLTGNQSYDIRAEDTIGVVRPLAYVNGATDYAAAATEWDNGANNKFWSVKFKAAGYSSFKIYSVQSSDATAPGPKFWQIQARKSGDSWTVVTGGDITVATDWTTGTVNALPLPSSFDDPGSTSVYVRWIMTSNESTNGNPVLPGGISMIDNIMITGESTSGIETVLYDSRVKVFPNPAADFINISLDIETDRIQIHDVSGAVVLETEANDSEVIIPVSNLKSGIYVLTIIPSNDTKVIRRKIMIQR